MNALLWCLQAGLALLCIAGGAFQLFKFDDLQPGVAAMRELPRGLWTVFGAVNCLGGLGLLLPATLTKLPNTMAIAASVVGAESALISALYIYFGDRPPLSYSLAMTAMAAFIAYGRFALKPA